MSDTKTPATFVEEENVSIEITESEDQAQEIAILNDEYKTKQLKRFDTAVSDAAIAELKETYLPLKVTSVDDKAIVKQVREGRLKARNYRLNVVKIAEKIVGNPKEFISMVNSRRDEIVNELKSFERATQEQEDLFDQLKTEAEEKREKDLQEKFDARLARIVDLKMEFVGDRYVLGDKAHILNMEIADFSDAEFDAFIENVRPIAAEIVREQEVKKRLEERKISLRQIGFLDNGEGEWAFHEMIVGYDKVQERDEEQFADLLFDAKVIADRVKKEMDEFKAHQAKLKQDQEDMEKQKLQMAAQKLTLRQEQLKSLGMIILEHGSASHVVDFMDKSQIESMPDDQFAEWCHGFRSSVWQFENEKAEQERLKNRNGERVSLLVEFGCKIISNKEDIEKEVFYIKGPLSVNETTERGDIYSASDEEFAEIVKTFKLAAEKKDEEQAHIDRAVKRGQELSSIGFVQVNDGFTMSYIGFREYSEDEKKEGIGLFVTDETIHEQTDDEWKETIVECTAFIKTKTEHDLLWKQHNEKKAEEAKEARRVALLPDKKKLIEFAAKVAALRKEMPEMATQEGKVIRERQLAAVQSLAHTIKVEAEAMS